MPEKPEEWDAAFSKLGRPESPDKYAFAKPDLGAGVEVPKEFEAAARTRAHALGMNQVQFDRYVAAEVADFKESVASANQGREQGMAAIQSMWGANTDRNVAVAQRGLQFYDPEGVMMSRLEETGLGNDPMFIKLFYDLGLKLQEDGLVTGEFQGIFSKDAAKAKIESLAANPAYTDAMHPDHDRVVAEMQKYYQIAHN